MFGKISKLLCEMHSSRLNHIRFGQPAEVLLGRATRYVAAISRRYEAKKPCRSVAVNAQTPLFEYLLRYARYLNGSYTYRLSRELVPEQRVSADSSHLLVAIAAAGKCLFKAQG